ncbi:MAG: histidine phosphatase family protein [Planctomycetes bacterium]|nr:histidine phosphatase family protein [Planctomycetota bacterium]
MKTLLILRHAKSSWDDESLRDHDRPLNKRGKRDAPRLGRLLLEKDLVPDQILSSTATRARKTAAKVAEACGFKGAIELRSELYPTEPQAFAEVVRELYHDEAARLLVVGHNPGLEDVLAALVGEPHVLPSAALAHVELPVDTWREFRLDGGGRLANLWRPKELEDQ